MGRIRNVSSDLPREVGRGGVRAARLSKKDTADKPKRSRVGARTTRTTNERAKVVEEPLVIEEFESVWDALGFSPQEAANLQARSELMLQLRAIIRENGWTQAVAAKRCGVSQPRINDLLRGKIGKFSIDALVNMATALGRRVDFELKAA
jgi:predicted XRE-type DNA-binding protein